MEKSQQQFSLWYFVGVFLVLLVIQSFFMTPHVAPLAYSEFKTLLRAGKIARVTLGSPYLRGVLRAEGLEHLQPQEKIAAIKETTAQTDTSGLHPFVTIRVDDPDLVRDLETAKVPYTGQVESTWVSTLLAWVVPMLLFFGLWSFLVRRMGPQQGLMSIGKSKAKVYMEKRTGVTFKDVAGIDEAKAELQEVVHFLKNPDMYRRLGAHLPKGVCCWWGPLARAKRYWRGPWLVKPGCRFSVLMAPALWRCLSALVPPGCAISLRRRPNTLPA